MSSSVRNKGGKKASLAFLFTTAALLVVIVSLSFPFFANAYQPPTDSQDSVPSTVLPNLGKKSPAVPKPLPPPKKKPPTDSQDSVPSTILPNLGKKSPAVPKPLPPPKKKPPTHSQDSAPSTILPNLGKISPAVRKPLPPPRKKPPPKKSPPLS
ncbi:vegetative cell wall protein gp1-like [Papaver somniferum]|uniref:vegetative cell wall protein gp1-like n=1 Tax=Papaver somniferum TaxID=3469 RepID=UPI000E7006F0|nr:vegetative cell wall protein gp1-like [Papaver somniferum]